MSSHSRGTDPSHVNWMVYPGGRDKFVVEQGRFWALSSRGGRYLPGVLEAFLVG